jgi:hypothetical protein
MTRFEYVAIFYGIVVALAVETVVVCLHRLLAAGKRVRWHWMAPATAINASLLTLGEFWVLWGDRDQWTGHYSFFQFLPFAISLLFMFLTAAATLPDRIPADGIDLKAFYFENRRHYWGLVAAFFLFNTALNLVTLIRFGPTAAWREDLPRLFGDLVGVAIAAPLIVFRSYWVHLVGIVAALATLLVFLSSIEFN